jgi:cytochrome c oxidase assembly factor CtaG
MQPQKAGRQIAAALLLSRVRHILTAPHLAVALINVIISIYRLPHQVRQ